jgi:(p)ppGpp synthase/HD superfamily hydrolase
MLKSQRYAYAVSFAAKAHAGQFRKGGRIPYISHPLAVSALVVEYGGDEDQAIAALLHDVVEDCGVSLLTLSEEFGLRVAAIVEACTDGVPDERGVKAPWRERKERYLAHLEQEEDDALLVSACDKLHNAKAIVSDIRETGLEVFDRFTASREEVLWYYRRLAGVFERCIDRPSLVRALVYEIAAMWDFGTPDTASPL